VSIYDLPDTHPVWVAIRIAVYFGLPLAWWAPLIWWLL
jgi:hypothetical protein